MSHIALPSSSLSTNYCARDAIMYYNQSDKCTGVRGTIQEYSPDIYIIMQTFILSSRHKLQNFTELHVNIFNSISSQLLSLILWVVLVLSVQKYQHMGTDYVWKWK